MSGILSEQDHQSLTVEQMYALIDRHFAAIRKLQKAIDAPSRTAERVTFESALKPKAFTPAEVRVARYLLCDLTMEQIGRELGVAGNTVKTHTISIYRKLGVKNRRHAAEALAALAIGGEQS